jgi:SpoIIAA-like
MIKLIEGLPPYVVGFEAFGKVEESDYKDVLDPALTDAIAKNDKIRVLYVLGEHFTGYSPGAMWEDAVVGTKDFSKWDRIAVVSDTEWVHASVSAFGWAVPGRIRTFPVAERDAAVAWVTEP